MPLHSTLTGSELHEPKGIATAGVGTVYIANGTGGGAWQKPGGAVCGSMCVVGNAVALAVTAAVDGTLNTDSDYTHINNSVWEAVVEEGVTFDTDGYLIVPTDGVYEMSLSASLFGDTVNTLTAFKLGYGAAGTDLVEPKSIMEIETAGVYYNVSKSCYFNLTAGDKLGIWIACDKNNNVTIEEASFTCVQLVEAS